MAWRCPNCGSYSVVPETQGMDEQSRFRYILLSLISIFFYLYYLATASRPTGYLVCLRCGARWLA